MSNPIEYNYNFSGVHMSMNFTLSGIQIVTFDPVAGQAMASQPPFEPAFPPPNFEPVPVQDMMIEYQPLHQPASPPPHYTPGFVQELDPLDEDPAQNVQLAQPLMPLMPIMPIMPAVPAVPAVPALPLPDLQDEVVRRPQPKKFPRASKAARSQAWKAMLRKFEISHMRRMALRRAAGYSSRFQKPCKTRGRGHSPMPAAAI